MRNSTVWLYLQGFGYVRLEDVYLWMYPLTNFSFLDCFEWNLVSTGAVSYLWHHNEPLCMLKWALWHQSYHFDLNVIPCPPHFVNGAKNLRYCQIHIIYILVIISGLQKLKKMYLNFVIQTQNCSLSSMPRRIDVLCVWKLCQNNNRNTTIRM